MRNRNLPVIQFFSLSVILLFAASCSRKHYPASEARDYLPTTPGSYWNYTGDIVESKKMTGKTKTFNGRIFQEGETIYNDNKTAGYICKENGNYYSRGFLGAAGDTLELIILKDNVPAGTTWSTTLSSSMAPIAYKFTVDEKDIRVIVNGTPYENVIKVKMEVSFVVNSILRPIATEYIFFAPKVGMVQFQTISSKGNVKFSSLDSFHIK
jgi:hypothetical protein